MFISDVYGYLDPGTASAIGAIVLSAIIGFGVYVKLYWQKFKEKFKQKTWLKIWKLLNQFFDIFWYKILLMENGLR